MRSVGAPLRMALAAAVWIGCVGVPASAQISPGPLSAPHAELEGSDRCLKCHSQKKRISAERCLDCHQILSEQLDLGLGFHVTVVEQGCERCHMEHHGVDFELVYWGEDGEAAFDHTQTSYRLQGAHTSLPCRSCHKESLIRSKDRFQERGKNLSRTFLGLDGSACLSCHVDEHQGQFPDRSCEACHSLDKWTEGNLFRHESARYPLVGKHRQVACNRCHLQSSGEESDAADFVKYTDLPFSTCTACHRDPHAGRLGSTCQQCHSENGWGSVSMQNFNHDRTRYPLVGAHQRVTCEGCHPQGVAEPSPRFSKCTDCHPDHHLGQFAERPQGAECDSCHDLQGFRPARFTVSAHQDSGYPLAGAHLAIACDACHVPLDSQQRQSFAVSGKVRPHGITGQTVYRYTFPETVCSACHTNPHEPGLDRFMLERDCLSCHVIAGWRRIDFDHERTDYSLAGGHQRASCLECHRIGDPDQDSLRLEFDGLPQDCMSCHEDPHRGQFAKDEEKTVCTRCHSFESWRRLRFDHDRDSTFPLDGVHVRVACDGCHRVQPVGQKTMIRYKPLGRECRDCHSGSEPAGAARTLD